MKNSDLFFESIVKDFMSTSVRTPMPKKTDVKSPWEVVYERSKQVDINDKALTMLPEKKKRIKSLYVQKLLKQWNVLPAVQRMVSRKEEEEKDIKNPGMVKQIMEGSPKISTNDKTIPKPPATKPPIPDFPKRKQQFNDYKDGLKMPKK